MKLFKLQKILNQDTFKLISSEGVGIDTQKIKNYLRLCYQTNTQDVFVNKVPEVCDKLGISLSEKSKIHRDVSILVPSESENSCIKCGGEVIISLPARSSIYNYEINSICRECGHKDSRYGCSCVSCTREIKEREARELDLKFRAGSEGAFKAIKKLKKKKEPSDFKEYVKLFRAFEEEVEASKNGKTNLYALEELVPYGLCPPSNKLETNLDSLLDANRHNIEAMKILHRNPLHFLLWVNIPKINENSLHFFLENFLIKIDESIFCPLEIQSYLDNSRTIIKDFIIAFGNEMDIDLSDVKDITVSNVAKLLRLMSINKTLYEVKRAIKSGFSYGVEKRLYAKGIRNCCVSNLNRAFEKYNSGEWQIPNYQVEDWELEEKYNINPKKSDFIKDLLIIAESDLNIEVRINMLKDKLLGKELQNEMAMY